MDIQMEIQRPLARDVKHVGSDAEVAHQPRARVAHCSPYLSVPEKIGGVRNWDITTRGCETPHSPSMLSSGSDLLTRLVPSSDG